VGKAGLTNHAPVYSGIENVDAFQYLHQADTPACTSRRRAIEKLEILRLVLLISKCPDWKKSNRLKVQG
jgi:hypothetical protein